MPQKNVLLWRDSVRQISGYLLGFAECWLTATTKVNLHRNVHTAQGVSIYTMARQVSVNMRVRLRVVDRGWELFSGS